MCLGKANAGGFLRSSRAKVESGTPNTLVIFLTA